MLEESFDLPFFRKQLAPRSGYAPYPPASDRSFWSQVEPELRARILAKADSYRGLSWPPLSARLYMLYSRTGDREQYQRRYFHRCEALAHVVLGECLTAEGRYADDIGDLIWAICEESSWVVPAHNGQRVDPTVQSDERDALPDAERPYIDLFSAETGGLLAWTDYLLRGALDQVSPLLHRRIEYEVRRRIVVPYMEHDDFWWMGFEPSPRHTVNNWNPWCNSNCLSCILLLAPDEATRAEGTAKVVRSLDRFLATYHPDGGCDEGPSYWNVAGGSLFDCLTLLEEATGGAASAFDRELIKRIGAYIYRVHVHDSYFLNFADAGAKVTISAPLVYRFGDRIGDPAMQDLAAEAFHRSGRDALGKGYPLFRTIPAIQCFSELAGRSGGAPYLRDTWLSGIQVCACREQEGSPAGLYMAAKGGHNGESHNHNDIGQLVVYVDGEPALIDVGVETYTAKTFSHRRYEIWTMQSAYHNLPTVNGVQQAPGRGFAAADVHYAASAEEVVFSLDLAPAYPEEAGLRRWHRRLAFRRGGSRSEITMTEQYAFRSPRNSVSLCLMLPKEPSLAEAGVVRLLLDTGKALNIRYSAPLFRPRAEELEVQDARLSAVWGSRLYRVVLEAEIPADRGEHELNLSVSM
jgi:hypothetical protein